MFDIDTYFFFGDVNCMYLPGTYFMILDKRKFQALTFCNPYFGVCLLLTGGATDLQISDLN